MGVSGLAPYLRHAAKTVPLSSLSGAYFLGDGFLSLLTCSMQVQCHALHVRVTAAAVLGCYFSAPLHRCRSARGGRWLRVDAPRLLRRLRARPGD
eukprot:6208274-Pleurochrysis_carterae.AAC.1